MTKAHNGSPKASHKSFGLRSLQTRLTVFVTVIATLVLTASGTYDFFTSRQAKMSELRGFTQHLAERTGSILERPLWNVDRPAVASIVQTEMKDKRVYAMIVVEDDNKRVFFGRMRNGASLESVPDLSDSMIFIKEPIVVGDLYIGSVLIYVTPEYLQKELAKQVMDSVLRSLVIVSVLGVLLVFMVRRIVLRPLSRLSKTVGHIISAGEYSVRTDKELDDEFGSLADSFNTMLELIETRESMLNSRSKHLEALVSERTAELEKSRAKAEEASRAKSEFVANMSHELRTPMNAIIGMIDIIRKTEVTSKQAEYLRIIKTSARSLLGIVNDILDFSKIEAQKLELETIAFSLHNTLEEVTDMFSERVMENNAEFIVDIGADVPDGCMGDPLRLRQVLVNLITNAFKFTEQGEIYFQVRPVEVTDSRYVLKFSVTDTGVGIDSAARDSLFEMFTQADGSTTRRYGGTGLGLAISRELVALMGGTIEVESEVGKGSTFTFTVQFTPTEIESPVARQEIVEQLKNKRILLVEDNASNRHVIGKMLRGLGLVCEALEDGEEALAVLQERGNMYDAVLLDWRLPGMNGLEVLDTLNLRHVPLPPVLMMTAFGRDTEAQRADELGVAQFLMKPVKIASLRNAIMSAFGLATPEPAIDEDVVSAAEFTGVRVLLVEDNIINQQVAREVLESEGLVVETADNGEEALDLLGRRSFDVVFMDIQMPGMDGFETTKRIRQRSDCQEIPIIAMTAHVMSEDKEEALNVGMNDYLTKPIDRLLLFSVLRKWVGRATRPAKLPPSLFTESPQESGVSLSDKFLSPAGDTHPAQADGMNMSGAASNGANGSANAERAATAPQTPHRTGSLRSQTGSDNTSEMPANGPDGTGTEIKAAPAAMTEYTTTSLFDSPMSAPQQASGQAYDQQNGNALPRRSVHPAAERSAAPPSSLFTNIPDKSELASQSTAQSSAEAAQSPMESLPHILPGLNVIEGVNRVSGKLWLYRSILEGFLANYRYSKSDLDQLFSENSQDDSERLAHTIAGAAGNVSATQVRTVCLNIEEKLRRNESGIEAALGELAHELETACASMESIIPHLPAKK